MRGLSGKVAIVTGASRGMGKGIALALADEGATVYVTGRTVSPGTFPLPGTVGETAAEVDRRGGKGIAAMAVNARNGNLVASFPVEEGDEIMLVTDGGQLIRCPVSGIRVAGRNTQGVIVFDTAERERVVSVERISEPDAEEEASETGD